MSSAGTAYVDIEAKLDSLASDVDAAISAIDTQTIDIEAVAAVAHEADKTKTRTEFVSITERVRDEIEIEKVVYRNVCISAGGLRELANAARATGYTGEPGNGLPADQAAD